MTDQPPPPADQSPSPSHQPQPPQQPHFPPPSPQPHQSVGASRPSSAASAWRAIWATTLGKVLVLGAAALLVISTLLAVGIGALLVTRHDNSRFGGPCAEAGHRGGGQQMRCGPGEVPRSGDRFDYGGGMRSGRSE